MRFLGRISLPQKVLRALQFYQSGLNDALVRNPDVDQRGTLIRTFWKNRRDSTTLRAVELALEAMASGLSRCMYCEDSAGSDIEHFRPEAHHPHVAFHWPNLLWICATCNRQKNEDFNDRILDPTADADILDHLSLSFTDGRLTVRNSSERGTTTLGKLRRLAEDQKLMDGRCRVFRNLKRNLRLYDACQLSGEVDEAAQIHSDLVIEPFSSVLACLLRSSRDPNAETVLGKEMLNILTRHPDIHGWLHESDALRFANARIQLDTIAQRIRLATGENEA